MKIVKKCIVIIFLSFIILGTFVHTGLTQAPFLSPWGASWMHTPLPIFNIYSAQVMNAFSPFACSPSLWRGPFNIMTNPMPVRLSPYQRSPHATIIFNSATITAVNSAPGIILIGSTTALGITAAALGAITPVPLIPSVNPAPLPLSSMLTVNPLLEGRAMPLAASSLLFTYLPTLLF